LIAKGYLVEQGEDIELTRDGEGFIEKFGIDMTALAKSRRPLCKSCLDWSSRRTHLAGSLGTAFLNQFYELGWASRQEGSRIIKFTTTGEQRLLQELAS